jgi:hypothetical protein
MPEVERPDAGWRFLPEVRPALATERLFSAAAAHRADRALDIRLLARPELRRKAIAADLWGAPSLFGPVWSGHPFTGPGLFRHIQLTEPQITRELAAWLNRPDECGGSRAIPFLTAMLAIPPYGASCDDWGDFITRADAVVEAEKDPSVTGRRRARRASRRNGALDLFVTLVRGKERRHVVVEAKCEAPLGPGQLERYLRATRGLPDTRYILLSPVRLRALETNPVWTWCGWRGLLARWERLIAIAGDDDPVFRQFRFELFRRFL